MLYQFLIKENHLPLNNNYNHRDFKLFQCLKIVKDLLNFENNLSYIEY